MEKAFDLKALVAKLDAKGVPVLEDAAKVLVMETLDWVQESVVLSDNKIDDVALALIPMVKTMLAPVLEQIDGKQ